jgi:hypothetical protein
VLIKKRVSVTTVNSFCVSSVQADEIIFSHSGRNFMRYVDPHMDDVIFKIISLSHNETSQST